MSLFSSFIIDPVVRQARRFSGTSATQPSAAREISRSLSHVNQGNDGASSYPPQAQQTATEATERGDSTAAQAQNDTGTLIAAVFEDEHYLDPALHQVPAQPLGQDLQDSLITPSLLRRATAPAPTSMSSNPAHVLASRSRQLNLDAASQSTTTLDSQSSRSSAIVVQNAPTMSELLPADDGMRQLRARIHQIRDLPLPDEEKARMMHHLMMERWSVLRPTSPSSFLSHDRPSTPTSGQSVFSDSQVYSPISAASEVDPENPFRLRPGDTDPTYRSPPAHDNPDAANEDDDDHHEDELVLGCQHYKRNVKVQCFECRRWHTCRHCHDAVEDHNLNRVMTKNMLCMVCGTPQKAGEHCVQCGTQAACYYCDACKLWDNNSAKKIYHCVDCGICRRGEGLGKDYVHCKNCNVCISIAHATSHKCIERATDCDCPICGEWLFNSSTAVVSMPCGHYLHKGCYNQYMETAYKCPTCKKSAVNMELQWQKLTQAIESQPMPEQFADTRAIIQCNDCSARSSVKYHWLGNKCNTCESYNTNEMRILNGPESEQNANAILSAEVDLSSGARSPLSVSSPASQPLRSPRYYFQPDEPEQTWLPGQLPSFPFQIPQLPVMPQMPQIPQFPGIRQLPGMPQFPQMPQMPDPYEMLERVRRSFDHYLNPTGEVPNEAVPIIDLDVDEDDHREIQATDGTTVRLPALPQYVLERFNQSINPLRNYWTPTTEQIPTLDLDDGGNVDNVRPWRDNIFREYRYRNLNRSSGDGEEREAGSGSSSSSEESAEEEDEEEAEVEEDDNEWDLPGHR
ncbi:unnamed protein product [Periconia digitata]|uniref:Zf-CHY-domain-containing protein n=1 Tax=Periconia digitata TaxID=1303443 RepID=A0A9W4XNN1_9PLEO|nr:unnamed protein product [Periconia digitata]